MHFGQPQISYDGTTVKHKTNLHFNTSCLREIYTSHRFKTISCRL